MREYNAMTHEELVQAVYKLAQQLTPEEQQRIFNKIIAKREQEATK